jgi:hypothetical protein
MPAGNTYEAIATQTLGSAAATVTFSSIPQTYTDLVLVLNATSSTTANSYVRINSDSGANYSWNVLYGSGSVAGTDRAGSVSNGVLMDYYGYPTSTIPNVNIIQFMNYSNTTTFKTVLGRANQATTSGGIDLITSMWRSTAAITELTLRFTGSQTWSTGSTFSLYGIKAA